MCQKYPALSATPLCTIHSQCSLDKQGRKHVGTQNACIGWLPADPSAKRWMQSRMPRGIPLKPRDISPYGIPASRASCLQGWHIMSTAALRITHHQGICWPSPQPAPVSPLCAFLHLHLFLFAHLCGRSVLMRVLSFGSGSHRLQNKEVTLVWLLLALETGIQNLRTPVCSTIALSSCLWSS